MNNFLKHSKILLLTIIVTLSLGSTLNAFVPQVDAAKKAHAKKSKPQHKKGKIIGNLRSKIFHLPGQVHYKISKKNRIYFKSVKQAKAMGYHQSKR